MGWEYHDARAVPKENARVWRGVWCVVCGVRSVECGVWCGASVCGSSVCGVGCLCVVCGVWCVVCGVWCVVCGVWGVGRLCVGRVRVVVLGVCVWCGASVCGACACGGVGRLCVGCGVGCGASPWRPRRPQRERTCSCPSSPPTCRERGCFITYSSSSLLLSSLRVE